VDQVVLVLITFVAATVNGALGYDFHRLRSCRAALLHQSYFESGVSARGIGDQWVRLLHQPQEHPEHLMARDAHPDRPPDRRWNRQLCAFPRSSVVGQVCDLRHAVAVDSAPGCRYQTNRHGFRRLDRRVRIVQNTHRIRPGHRIHHVRHPHDHDDGQCLLTISIFSR